MTKKEWDIQNKGNLYGRSARLEVVAGINIAGKKILPTIATLPGLSSRDYDNARLIAAAPELLKACMTIKRIAPELWGPDEEKWPRVMDRVEAAIRKAIGDIDEMM